MAVDDAGAKNGVAGVSSQVADKSAKASDSKVTPTQQGHMPLDGVTPAKQPESIKDADHPDAVVSKEDFARLLEDVRSGFAEVLALRRGGKNLELPKPYKDEDMIYSRVSSLANTLQSNIDYVMGRDNEFSPAFDGRTADGVEYLNAMKAQTALLQRLTSIQMGYASERQAERSMEKVGIPQERIDDAKSSFSYRGKLESKLYGRDGAISEAFENKDFAMSLDRKRMYQPEGFQKTVKDDLNSIINTANYFKPEEPKKKNETVTKVEKGVADSALGVATAMLGPIGIVANMLGIDKLLQTKFNGLISGTGKKKKQAPEGKVPSFWMEDINMADAINQKGWFSEADNESGYNLFDFGSAFGTKSGKVGSPTEVADALVNKLNGTQGGGGVASQGAPPAPPATPSEPVPSTPSEKGGNTPSLEDIMSAFVSEEGNESVETSPIPQPTPSPVPTGNPSPMVGSEQMPSPVPSGEAVTPSPVPTGNPIPTVPTGSLNLEGTSVPPQPTVGQQMPPVINIPKPEQKTEVVQGNVRVRNTFELLTLKVDPTRPSILNFDGILGAGFVFLGDKLDKLPKDDGDKKKDDHNWLKDLLTPLFQTVSVPVLELAGLAVTALASYLEGLKVPEGTPAPTTDEEPEKKPWWKPKWLWFPNKGKNIELPPLGAPVPVTEDDKGTNAVPSPSPVPVPVTVPDQSFSLDYYRLHEPDFVFVKRENKKPADNDVVVPDQKSLNSTVVRTLLNYGAGTSLASEIKLGSNIVDRALASYDKAPATEQGLSWYDYLKASNAQNGFGLVQGDNANVFSKIAGGFMNFVGNASLGFADLAESVFGKDTLRTGTKMSDLSETARNRVTEPSLPPLISNAPMRDATEAMAKGGVDIQSQSNWEVLLQKASEFFDSKSSESLTKHVAQPDVNPLSVNGLPSTGSNIDNMLLQNTRSNTLFNMNMYLIKTVGGMLTGVMLP